MQFKLLAAIGTISIAAMMMTVSPVLSVDMIGMCQDLSREVESAEGGSHLELEISACTAAIETQGFGHSTYAVLYGARAAGYYFKGQYDRAIADYDQSLQHFPEYFPAICNRGLAKQKIGDTAGANADFARARQLRPQQKCE